MNKFTAEHLQLQAGIFRFKDPNGRIICEVPMNEIQVRPIVRWLNKNIHNLDFRLYLKEHMSWSVDAFGEGSRLDGIIEHIEEELEEVKENPKDTREWVDIISLAIDGALREGASIGDLMNAMKAVQLRNKHRTWEATPPNRKANHVVVDDPCDECGTTDPTDEVVKSEIEWYVWGRNAFDMNWKQVREEKHLCDECERKTYEICAECGARISRNFYGIGYLPNDWEGDSICPGCAEEKGLEITVNLQPLSKPE